MSDAQGCRDRFRACSFSTCRFGSCRFGSWREQIATRAHRLDHGRIGRIGLDLAADAADQHVNRALERAGAAPLREVEQAVARQHAARPLAECPQQVELGAGHRDARACGIAQFAQAQIDAPAFEGERACAFDRARRLRGRPGGAAPR